MATKANRLAAGTPVTTKSGNREYVGKTKSGATFTATPMELSLLNGAAPETIAHVQKILRNTGKLNNIKGVKGGRSFEEADASDETGGADAGGSDGSDTSGDGSDGGSSSDYGGGESPSDPMSVGTAGFGGAGGTTPLASTTGIPGLTVAPSFKDKPPPLFPDRIQRPQTLESFTEEEKAKATREANAKEFNTFGLDLVDAEINTRTFFNQNKAAASAAAVANIKSNQENDAYTFGSIVGAGLSLFGIPTGVPGYGLGDLAQLAAAPNKSQQMNEKTGGKLSDGRAANPSQEGFGDDGPDNTPKKKKKKIIGITKSTPNKTTLAIAEPDEGPTRNQLRTARRQITRYA